MHLHGWSFQGISFTSSYFFWGQACCSIASCRTRDLYTAGADFGETLCIDAVQVDCSQQARELFGAIRIVRAIRSDVVQKQRWRFSLVPRLWTTWTPSKANLGKSLENEQTRVVQSLSDTNVLSLWSAVLRSCKELCKVKRAIWSTCSTNAAKIEPAA